MDLGQENQRLKPKKICWHVLYKIKKGKILNNILNTLLVSGATSENLLTKLFLPWEQYMHESVHQLSTIRFNPFPIKIYSNYWKTERYL